MELSIKTLVGSIGERLPILTNANGELDYLPNLYALTYQRARNRGSHTIENSLRAIAIAHQFFICKKINIERRLAEGDFLARAELEELNRLCRYNKKDIDELLVSVKEPSKKEVLLNPLLRKNSPRSFPEITRQTAALRQIYIKSYLLWLLDWSAHSTHAPAQLFGWAKKMSQRVRTSFPTSIKRRSKGVRQGLSDDAQQELLRIISPRSADNPWESKFCRSRNSLLIILLFYLGVRRGELLALQVRDLNFSKNKILVARRPDNPEDSRRYQPLVKTLPRELPLESGLAEQVYEYIHVFRKAAPLSKKHPFLFVSQAGAPFSLSGISHVYKDIRAASPQLLGTFSGHILRHTWNDRFSQLMQKNGVPPALEQQIRCYLMGWVPHSRTAEVYTKRYVQEEAIQFFLQIQQQVIRAGEFNERA